MDHNTGPVDYNSITITTISNVTLLAITNMHIFFQWVGYISVLLGFIYNLVKFIGWIKQQRFFKRKNKNNEKDFKN